MTLSCAPPHECINRAQLGKFRDVQNINIAWDTLARASKEGHLNLPTPGKRRKGEDALAEARDYLLAAADSGSCREKAFSPAEEAGVGEWR